MRLPAEKAIQAVARDWSSEAAAAVWSTRLDGPPGAGKALTSGCPFDDAEPIGGCRSVSAKRAHTALVRMRPERKHARSRCIRKSGKRPSRYQCAAKVERAIEHAARRRCRPGPPIGDGLNRRMPRGGVDSSWPPIWCRRYAREADTALDARAGSADQPDAVACDSLRLNPMAGTTFCRPLLLAREPDRRPWTPGMTRHIGQRLLHHAKQNQFSVRASRPTSLAARDRPRSR